VSPQLVGDQVRSDLVQPGPQAAVDGVGPFAGREGPRERLGQHVLGRLATEPVSGEAEDRRRMPVEDSSELSRIVHHCR
jgi:hypothetical protein